MIELMAEDIKQKEYGTILIEGHTDNVGKEAKNRILSANRAKAVFQELVKNGLDIERMQFVGLGSQMPKASNKTVKGRAENRRVEIFVR
jgi:outer membrane protein OmpA-like peptidoglycan-associated protein